MENRITVSPREGRVPSETVYAEGPMVIVGDDNELNITAVFSVVLVEETEEDGSSRVYVVGDNPERERYYYLDSVSDFNADVEDQEITFEAQGTIYSVRRFEDADGLWASATGTPVPAKILEEIFMDSVNVLAAGEPGANYAPEELYTLTDDSGNVSFLVYSGANQTFIRKAGAWEPLDDPDGDMLDDLYIDYVSPEFVDYFDKNEKKGLTTADVAKSVEDSSVTASASTGLKFAGSVNKKD